MFVFCSCDLNSFRLCVRQCLCPWRTKKSDVIAAVCRRYRHCLTSPVHSSVCLCFSFCPCLFSSCPEFWQTSSLTAQTGLYHTYPIPLWVLPLSFCSTALKCFHRYFLAWEKTRGPGEKPVQTQENMETYWRKASKSSKPQTFSMWGIGIVHHVPVSHHSLREKLSLKIIRIYS